jgi:hypothetical protein
MLPCHSKNQLRTGRSGDNRLLTCIEAQEAGYSFVGYCSKCDYYLQNKALNMKARTLPRSELSKMWQCTSLHKFADVYHSYCTNTPYKPASPKKSNSYICSTRPSILLSARKRVQLFDATPVSEEKSQSTSQAPANEHDQSNVASLIELKNVEAQRDVAVRDRDIAIAERDRAIKEKNDMIALNDSFIKERDMAYLKADSSKVECYRLIVQRDKAVDDRNLFAAENDKMLGKLAALESEVMILRRRIEVLNHEKQAMMEKYNNANAQLAVYAERQSRLSDRVTALESRQLRSTLVDVRSTGSKIQYISKFANKLFPEVDRKKQLISLFDLLYSQKKYFKKM